MAPVTAGVLTVVVAASTAVAGQFAHKTDPELDVALPQPRASISGGVATEPPPPPTTTLSTPTAAPTPTSAPTYAESSVTQQPASTSRKTTTAATPSTSSSTHASPSATSRPSSGAVSGGAVQFRGDFDTDNASQWELETAQNYSLRVADGGAGHRTAGRFEVRDGDPPVHSGERSEAKLPNSTDVSDGDERWYSFSMMFDKSFPVPADGWCDPMQWHPANSDHSAAEGSPALNLQCGNDGDDKLYLQVGDKELLPIGSLDRGVWHRYLLHVKFSNDPGTAFEEVHRDGQLVLPRTSPTSANMNSPKAYLKIGMYRKGTNDGSMVVWHDDMAVYTSAPTLSAG